MRPHRLELICSLPVLLLSATLAAGCGDDSSEPATGADSGLTTDETETDETETDETETDETETDETETDEAETDEAETDETETDETETDETETDETETDEAETDTDAGATTDDDVADAGPEVIDAAGPVVDASTDDETTDDETTTADAAAVQDAGDVNTDEAPTTTETDVVDAGLPQADAGPSEEAGPVEPQFDTISEVGQRLLPNVNDLRGLTYSADGGYIYASGFVAAAADADRQLALMRFLADGTPDDTFGTDGLVTHNLVTRVLNGEVVVNDGSEESFSVVELASGEFVLQANVRTADGLGSDVVLVKLNATGELVDTFGTGGVLRVDLGWTPTDDATFTVGSAPSDSAWDMRLDTSTGTEKLVIFAHGPARVGQMTGPADAQVQRTDNDRYILRVLASDGSFDPTFNGGVAYSLNSGGTFGDNGRRGEVLADGTIISAGYANFGDGIGNHVVAIRLLPNGTPDPAFGFGIAQPGVVRTNPFIDDGGIAECYALAQQSTGRYVTTGYGRATAAGFGSGLGWVTTDAQDLVSVGFNATGLDLTYGHSATVAIQSEEYALGGTEDRGRDLIVLEDDRIVHVGRFGIKPAIFVTLPDGEMDLDSGIDGRFEYDALTAPTSHFFKAAASPDRKFIAATTNNHLDGVLMTVLRVGD
jgi:uncharacterized delta-60 repeat protein